MARGDHAWTPGYTNIEEMLYSSNRWLLVDTTNNPVHVR